MRLAPYLSFHGNCAEAFKFYEQSLGGRMLSMFKYGEMPAGEPIPAELRDQVMHARLSIGDAELMGADSPSDQYQAPAGITVSLHLNDTVEAERIFGALAEGGVVQMPIQETFWAVRFAMLTDRFGVPWMINCEKTA